MPLFSETLPSNALKPWQERENIEKYYLLKFCENLKLIGEEIDDRLNYPKSEFPHFTLYDLGLKGLMVKDDH